MWTFSIKTKHNNCKNATRSKCIASSNKCLTSSNKCIATRSKNATRGSLLYCKNSASLRLRLWCLPMEFSSEIPKPRTAPAPRRNLTRCSIQPNSNGLQPSSKRNLIATAWNLLVMASNLLAMASHNAPYIRAKKAKLHLQSKALHTALICTCFIIFTKAHFSCLFIRYVGTARVQERVLIRKQLANCRKQFALSEIVIFPPAEHYPKIWAAGNRQSAPNHIGIIHLTEFMQR